MMKKYRKLSVLLIAAMLVGLCACGSKDDGKKGDGYKKEVDTYTKEKLSGKNVRYKQFNTSKSRK